MVETELKKLISQAETRKSEGQAVEVKSAHEGCPENLYDTISAFANQNSGGTLVFGLDERQGFTRVGVYDAQDLQKKVMEYCEQMTPVVRPVFTVTEEDGLVFVSAEIPPVDIAERPCFKTAKGRLTLAALLLLGVYPQAYFPQLSMIAAAVPATEENFQFVYITEKLRPRKKRQRFRRYRTKKGFWIFA